MNASPSVAPLSAHEDQAVRDLIQRLMHEQGDQIVGLVLFGSKARGDAASDSDIDILVVLDHEEWSLRSAISRLGARASLENDVLFNLYVVDQPRWAWMAEIRHPLWRNIQAEGIPLLPVSSVSA